jgi:hypothetical protein
MTPFAFVHVNADGTVREVTAKEREYLETPFAGSDGGRPYIKTDFFQKDGWGSLAGFCYRSLVPEKVAIRPAYRTTEG